MACTARGTLHASLLPPVLLAAAEPGFRVASVRGLRDTSALEYASHLGDVEADSGRGPVSDDAGWVRTGRAASTTQSCNAFPSPSGMGSGFRMVLRSPASWNAAATQMSPGQASAAAPCTRVASVWCIED